MTDKQLYLLIGSIFYLGAAQLRASKNHFAAYGYLIGGFILFLSGVFS